MIKTNLRMTLIKRIFIHKKRVKEGKSNKLMKDNRLCSKKTLLLKDPNSMSKVIINVKILVQINNRNFKFLKRNKNSNLIRTE